MEILFSEIVVEWIYRSISLLTTVEANLQWHCSLSPYNKQSDLVLTTKCFNNPSEMLPKVKPKCSSLLCRFHSTFWQRPCTWTLGHSDLLVGKQPISYHLSWNIVFQQEVFEATCPSHIWLVLCLQWMNAPMSLYNSVMPNSQMAKEI